MVMTADLVPLENCTIRVLSTEGKYHGLGYRLTADLVITCAHVVAQALDGEELKQMTDAPSGEVVVDAPFAEGLVATTARAAVVPGGWLPVRDCSEPSDLALLRVLGGPDALPELGPTPGLDPAISLAHKVFHAYGAPEGYGYERHPIHIEGDVSARIGNGRWQLSVREPGFTIMPGFSGAPAMDERTGQIIGLIAQEERDIQLRAGFLIPAQHLRQLLLAAGLGQLAAPGLEPVRRWINSRLRAETSGLDDDVRALVDHYADKPEHPMPFAGRDEAFDALDKHLRMCGGKLLIVSGAAGLGKSALLLHWMARLLRRNEHIQLLYLPISIRFNTATEIAGLQLLYSELASLFPEIVFRAGAERGVEDYRDRICNGWRFIANRPTEHFLLVVDGVDEASNHWFLPDKSRSERILPYEIPGNLTVVVTARHKPGHQHGYAWLDDLSVHPTCKVPEPLELPLLEREAVGEAVAQLGHPLDPLLEREGILEALYRLTDGGDPLLVNLWVGQLWTNRQRMASLTVTDLSRLQPGYAGFVEEWKREQIMVWRDAKIDAHPDDLFRLLRVLALAHGPLRLHDWLEIAGRLPSPVPWDNRFARKVLDNAYRLIVGDAKRIGYSFVHTRLADYFQAELTGIKEERAAIPRAYLHWGTVTVAALNAGDLPPDQCPIYLLRHYTDHVLAADLTPDDALDRYLLALLDSGWHRAWHEEEGAYGGYLRDVRRVQSVARRANEQRLSPPYRVGAELRCALICASIRTLGQNLWPELIIALADAQVWTVGRAIKVAGDLPDMTNQARALVGLADLCQRKQREHVLNAVLGAIHCISREDSRTRIMSLIVDSLFGEERSKFLAEWISIVHNIPDANSKAEALTAVALRLAGEERRQTLAQALEAARATGDLKKRVFRLLYLADQLDEPEHGEVLQEALAAGESQYTGWFGSHWGLFSAAKRVVREPGGLAQILKVARRLDASIQRGSFLEDVLRESIPESELLSLLDELLDLSRDIDHSKSRTDVLAALLKRLAAGQRQSILPEVLQAARDDKDPGLVAALDALMRTAPEEPESSYRVFDEGPYLHSRDFIKLLALMGKQPAALRLSIEVRQILLDDVVSYDNAFTQLMQRLPVEWPLLNELLEAVRRVGAKKERAERLALLAQNFAETHRFQLLREAVDTAHGITPAGERARALIAVANYFSDEDQVSIVWEALDAVRRDRSSRYYLRDVIDLARKMASEERKQTLRELFRLTVAIYDDVSRSKSLTALAGQLEGAQRCQILSDASEAARANSSEDVGRWQALAAIAGQLAGGERRQVLSEIMEAALDAKDNDARSVLLEAIAHHVVEEPRLLSQAIELTSHIEGSKRRASALKVLAKALGSDRSLMAQYLEAARGIAEKHHNVEALAEVAKQLVGEERRQLLRETLKALSEISEEDWRADGVEAVSDALGEDSELLAIALDLACRIGGEGHGIKALVALTTQLRGYTELLNTALDAARKIGDKEWRVRALTAVAAQLPDVEQRVVAKEALETALGINTLPRGSALAIVSGLMPQDKRQQLLGQALAIARYAHDHDKPGWCRDILEDILEHCNSDLNILQQALEIAADYPDDEVYAAFGSGFAIMVIKKLGKVPELESEVLQAAIKLALRTQWPASGLVKLANGLCLKKLRVAQAKKYDENSLETSTTVSSSDNGSQNAAHTCSGFFSILDAMCDLKRGDVLEVIQALVPATAALGGATAITETADAIRDTAHWWP